MQILGETENRFRNIADAAPIMIWVSNTDKLCSFFSKGWLDFTGRTLDQELGNGWSEGVHPDDLDRCLRTYMESFDRRQEFSMEYRLRRADGEYRWILNNGMPRFGPDGIFLGYMGSAVDISERKQAESRLNAQYDITRILSESASMAEAAPKILQSICSCLDWQYGEIWQVDQENKHPDISRKLALAIARLSRILVRESASYLCPRCRFAGPRLANLSTRVDSRRNG